MLWTHFFATAKFTQRQEEYCSEIARAFLIPSWRTNKSIFFKSPLSYSSWILKDHKLMCIIYLCLLHRIWKINLAFWIFCLSIKFILAILHMHDHYDQHSDFLDGFNIKNEQRLSSPNASTLSPGALRLPWACSLCPHPPAPPLLPAHVSGGFSLLLLFEDSLNWPYGFGHSFFSLVSPVSLSQIRVHVAYLWSAVLGKLSLGKGNGFLSLVKCS